jgi:hypothetical protein
MVLEAQVYGDEGQELGQVSSRLALPTSLPLAGYPNPFNASTTLRYELAQPGQVELVVYDLTGSTVRRMVSDWQGAGVHSVVWDARDEAGWVVGSGMYVAHLQSGRTAQFIKLMLLK